MANEENGISHGVNLLDGPVMHGAGLELLCCSTQPTNNIWASAAEIIYEITGEPGRVIRNTITFDLPGTKIELDLLSGSFKIFEDGKAEPIVGRKGLDLLMKWQRQDFDTAIKFVIDHYSVDHAMAMAQDFASMKVKSVSSSMQSSQP